MADDLPADDYPPERAAIFETLIEQSGPPPDPHCTCTWCVYGQRIRKLDDHVVGGR